MASVFFYISGVYYGRAKKRIEKEKQDAMAKAQKFTFENNRESIHSYGMYEYDQATRSYKFEKVSNIRAVRSYSGAFQPRQTDI